MYIDGKYITIEVQKGYLYDCEILSIGTPDDSPADSHSMWSWINHLRGKIWWDNFKEREFIKLAHKIIK